MPTEVLVTHAAFVRDVFEYMRYQHPSTNPSRQRWIEVDSFDTPDKELQSVSRLDAVTR